MTGNESWLPEKGGRRARESNKKCCCGQAKKRAHRPCAIVVVARDVRIVDDRTAEFPHSHDFDQGN